MPQWCVSSAPAADGNHQVDPITGLSGRLSLIRLRQLATTQRRHCPKLRIDFADILLPSVDKLNYVRRRVVVGNRTFFARLCQRLQFVLMETTSTYSDRLRVHRSPETSASSQGVICSGRSWISSERLLTDRPTTGHTTIHWAWSGRQLARLMSRGTRETWTNGQRDGVDVD